MINIATSIDQNLDYLDIPLIGGASQCSVSEFGLFQFKLDTKINQEGNQLWVTTPSRSPH